MRLFPKNIISFLISAFVIVNVLLSCQGSISSDNKKVIAKAYDNQLYLSDVKGLVNSGMSEDDSIAVMQNFIKNWIDQQLMLHQAELNLPEEKKDVDKQLEDYRNSLIIYAYQNELVKQMLDTSVTEKEIRDYYEKNKKNFELKDYILQIRFIQLDENTPKLKKVKKWFQFEDEKDSLKLIEYCRKYAVNYFLDQDQWIYYKDFAREAPLRTYNVEEFLKNNQKIVELQDNPHIYLLKIIDYRLKNSTSPLSLQRENIRNIIVNKRKIQLIDRIKKEIYEDALSREQFKVYGSSVKSVK